MAKSAAKANPATRAYEQGLALLRAHPVFGKLAYRVQWVRNDTSTCPATGWLLARRDESVHLHPKRLAQPPEWAYAMGRAVLLHALQLWQADRGDWPAWSAACDVVTARFMHGIKFGRAPEGMALPPDLPQWDEARWYREFCEHGVPAWAQALSLAAPWPTLQAPPDWGAVPGLAWGAAAWPEAFAQGIAASVQQAIEVAAGVRDALGGDAPPVAGRHALRAHTQRARDWFIGSYPLLGSMVAAFTFIEDAELCRREEVMVAAVDEQLRTIYLNPAAALGVDETRFVIAHEVLHVALRHGARCQGREPFLWNVACDFVINDWLIQMQVGAPPAIGLLHDLALRGLSAEEVYDRLARDLRRMRKLCTLAGYQGDMLRRRLSPERAPFTDLDAFCREQLGKGLLLHQQQGRGLLPAALLEEINAVLQPAIPWEVQLARWFDHHFPPIDTRRSYARLSRRQSATPDIPRPRVVHDENHRDGRTFGVVLDTSGSMDRHALARALGAIASYAEAKEVPAVRLVCCDAAPYDMGYLPASEIAGRVQLKGRGGTVLQPAVDLLQAAADFPRDGPLLIITDGECDHLSVRRSHAWLLPPGKRLAFAHQGEVFHMD
ncbi:MAG: hypothetical protein Q4G70_02005 [Pseudomonadota bacterium]|nr:hypothetical protein [Pseudomonadota bacterium]